MVYVDESGLVIENPDLSQGYLVDDTWIDHPEIKPKGHYEYCSLPDGGRLQRFVADTPARPAFREVTRRKYILYTAEELEERNGFDLSDTQMIAMPHDPKKDYSDCPVGFLVTYGGQAWRLRRPHNAAYYAGTPATLRSLWAVAYVANPHGETGDNT